ncbi:transcriptional regulator NrdR [Amphibiibacter pelophylacis]|uniref:Transcriptional regulator NrdR n=1 Tax=Amphibiibacter pelophylacis TaxID=1799477 RepID=A0ACC6P3P8_9BURK
MHCPYCRHSDTQVMETRVSDDGSTVRRRRRCTACERRFTSYERAEIDMPVVVKKDGTRTDFDPAKLRASMMLALRKRNVDIGRVDAAIAHISERLRTSGLKEVPTAHLGDQVMQELKTIDKVAFVRFASVYQSFEDVDAFRQLISDSLS